MVHEFVIPFLATVTPFALTTLITGIAATTVVAITIAIGRISDRLEK